MLAATYCSFLFIFLSFHLFVSWWFPPMFRGIYTWLVHLIQWPLSIMGFMNNKIAGEPLNNSMTNPDLWKGFDPNFHLLRNFRSKGQRLEKGGDPWTEVLSLQPRIFLFHNFLSKEECQYLIKLGTPYMTQSTVLNVKTGQYYYSSGKTSSESYLGRGRDKVIEDIEKRIADFTFIPVEHGQELLVLRYEIGQKNLPHYDTYGDGPSIKNGGPLIATVLMYLSDVEEGGETVFPSAKGDTMSECGKKGLSVKPKMGDALLFWTIRPDGTLDPSSLHGGNPVIKGNKWACTKWLHMQEFKV